jgi:predicted DNA-binding antitoxin AbrB/MazE fold protein
MLRTIEGIYRNGVLELLEPAPIQGTVRVLITFLEEQPEAPRKSKLPLLSVGECPENFSLRREDMYGDDGR